MSKEELAVDIRESEKSVLKNRKKQHKKFRRLGFNGLTSDSQQKERADPIPILRHMNPPATAKGNLYSVSKLAGT
jgi:hypothetical protein